MNYLSGNGVVYCCVASVFLTLVSGNAKAETPTSFARLLEQLKSVEDSQCFFNYIGIDPSSDERILVTTYEHGPGVLLSRPRERVSCTYRGVSVEPTDPESGQALRCADIICKRLVEDEYLTNNILALFYGTDRDGIAFCSPPHILSVLLAEATVLLGLALLLFSIRLRHHIKKRLFFPVAISAVAAIPTLTDVSSGTVVYYDEFHHGSITEAIGTGSLPLPCCSYENGVCKRGGPLLWPLSTHVLSVAALPFFSGPDRGLQARRATSLIATLIAPGLMWVWAMQLNPAPWPAAIATIAWSLFAARMKLSFSGALMPVTIVLMISLLIAVEAARTPDKRRFVTLCGLVILTMQSRTEMFLCLPWCIWRLRNTTALKPFIVASIASLIPVSWMVAIGSTHSAAGWNPDLKDFFRYLAEHSQNNFMAFTGISTGVPILFVLAISALIARQYRAIALACFSSAAILFLFYSSYHIGVFTPDSDGWRYMVPISVFITPLGSAGLSYITSRFKFALLITAALVPALYPFQHNFRSVSPAISGLVDSLGSCVFSHDTVAVTTQPAFVRTVTGLNNIVDLVTPALAIEGRHAVYIRLWQKLRPVSVLGRCLRANSCSKDPGDGLGPIVFDLVDCDEMP